jgi:hypothetical protein
MRTKTRKIVQINKRELEKCKVGKKFNVDFITYTDITPKPPKKPSRMDRLENSIVSLREIVIDGFKEIRTRLDNVEATQTQQGDLLERVIKLNNLKTE